MAIDPGSVGTGVIAQIGLSITTTLGHYTEAIFTGVAGPIVTLLDAVALLAFMFIAINHLIQFQHVNYSVYWQWGLRYILIYTFVKTWANFEPIYNLIRSVPQDYSSLILKAVIMNIPHYRDDILNPNNMTTTYGALDEAGHAVVWIAADFFRDTSISDIAGSILNILCGILFLVIGGLFIAVAAINVIIGEVGFALAMGIAPLALVALMIEQTKGHFQSWLQFALGFAILPLLAAALTSVVLFVAGQLLLIANAGSDNKAGYFPFLFIIIAALFLLFKLPEMASSLAGTSVMAASGRAPMAMASAVKNSAMKNAGRAMGAAKMAYRTGQRVRDGASVANSALKKGATKREAAWAAISGMRQSTMARQSRRDERLAKRMVGTAKNKAVPPAVAYKNDATNNSGS